MTRPPTDATAPDEPTAPLDPAAAAGSAARPTLATDLPAGAPAKSHTAVPVKPPAKPKSRGGKVNKAWLHEHLTDPFVKLAQKHDYRSRAAFKLTGIDEQDGLIRPGMVVVDLGSAPGAWSQVLRERLGRRGGVLNGRIVALDILPMEPIADVEFLQGDFREAETLARLEAQLGQTRVDLVVSDMAPNLSGVEVADMARMQDLAELAIDFSRNWLKPEGSLLIKCFHGSGYSQIVALFKRHFVSVLPRKPKASRDRSAENYLLGRRLRLPGGSRQGQPDRS
jgi:23S rRNA (uridine2552-2'-O)-methyltransferase